MKKAGEDGDRKGQQEYDRRREEVRARPAQDHGHAAPGKLVGCGCDRDQLSHAIYNRARSSIERHAERTAEQERANSQ
jgi:hypothetical protein